MATKSMAYDHPEYLVVKAFQGEIAAAVSSKSMRFCITEAMVLKSMQATVVTAGGTVNAVNLVRQAAGGTALTTMASIASTIGTNVGGVTINALATHASAGSLAQGDVLWAEKGSADGVGVYAIGIECVPVPGTTVTS
jgi:hypothetical protein